MLPPSASKLTVSATGLVRPVATVDVSITALDRIQASAVGATELIQAAARAVALVAQVAAIKLAIAEQRLVEAEARRGALELDRQVALFRHQT